MKMHEILDKIAAEPPRQPGVPTVPSRDMIAFTVRWARDLRGWKAATLASFAGVSLSSIERVERAEKVQIESLERIGHALGYAPGAFTVARLPIPIEKAASDFVEVYGDLQLVAVQPLATERLVRALARCDGYIIHRDLAGSEYDGPIAALAEWLGLTSFVLSEEFADPVLDRAEPGRRELYKSVLRCVADMNGAGLTVLGGVMNAPQPEFPDWRIAIIAVSPRATDPSAIKRDTLMVDRRCVALRV